MNHVIQKCLSSWQQITINLKAYELAIEGIQSVAQPL